MPNQLQKEKSPYLLQHKDNPVQWYPWGEEAFQLAKKQGKPIFLSIGYSTCHWCHDFYYTFIKCWYTKVSNGFIVLYTSYSIRLRENLH
nr:DUF255 domain-containing protein [Virgibacillus massiliensis]